MDSATPASTPPRLAKGVPVVIRVDPQRVAKDWTDAALRGRKPSGTGVITYISDAHGVCYQVSHDDDGTEGFYEAHELGVRP